MIRIGINGYGNLGRGVEKAIAKNPDMELVAIFSRRGEPGMMSDGHHPIYNLSEVSQFQDKIDVMILCGGSATDLPEQGPEMAALFHTVDSFDTHAKIPTYFEKVDQAAKTHQHLSLISCGWDPGLFSLARTLFESVLPDGKHYTFWGKGVSQGHSDAIRRIPGVQDARQYTVPVDAAVERARSSERPELTTREMHTRECYVVAKEGADKAKIEKEIKEMPNYFADYDTTVHFISQEELDRDHSGLPHGGFVIRNGNTSDQTTQIAEFKLTLDSNPEFTSSVLVAYARAIYRMAKAGKTGAVSVLDIPFALLSPKDPAELRKELL
ncbi:MAG TPA: diaminopimelate dehydrogenase [Candidatus Fimiplasma intestinipullorum]|uniref:Meso-diaminopimelate D-dehydrogenase n=1 Tax=Candidatus Fimiplasma intestinipullorum TaxID=2840825 RepID=A0A9D1KZD1_9FIRM|nr:diaminopimelate dehydrogenase [Candidatus Fimiplasma intestinipullorum]